MNIFLASFYLKELFHRSNQSGDDVDWMAKGIIAAISLGLFAILLLGFNRRQISLVFKQMRQRALSSSLTILSVALGVGLAVGVLLLQRESEKLFSQTDYGYDLIVGPKGSELQLVFNTVYQLDKSQGLIPFSVYEELGKDKHPQVRWAIPYVVGDHWEGHRIIATIPQIFPLDHENKPFPPEKVFQYRKDQSYQFAQGRPFHPEKFEAVVGSEVGLKVGDKFHPQHDAGTERGDEHEEQWIVVGVMASTHTAIDKVIYIPLISTYAIPEHEEGLKEMADFESAASGEEKHDAHEHEDHDAEAHEEHDDHAQNPATQAVDAHYDEGHGHHHHEHVYDLNPDGTINLKLPKDQWRVSAILVKSRGAAQAGGIQWQMKTIGSAMAINPAMVMSQFFTQFLSGTSRLLLLIALLVSIVAGVSILVSIYNSVVARKKEIAILRALGASKLRVLTILCMEAGFIGFLGSTLGLFLGHLLGFGGSRFLKELVNQDIRWMSPSEPEWIYVTLMVLLAILAGLLPAWVAYRTPVAKNLN
jgi:putative ABC transport system permease protein